MAAVAGVLLLLPLAALVVAAPWDRVAELARSPAVREAVGLSVVAPLLATLVVAVLGLPLAWVLARLDFPGRRLLRAVVLVPMVLPPVVGGVALLLAFGRRSLVGGWLGSVGIALPFTIGGVVVAAAFVALPFFVITVESALAGIDLRQEDAAASIGATPWRVVARVTLPLVRPALFAGTALAWARALGEFGATITFAGNLPGTTQTMPLAVYVLLQTDPDAAILLSLVLLALSITVLVALRGHWLAPLREQAPRPPSAASTVDATADPAARPHPRPAAGRDARPRLDALDQVLAPRDGTAATLSAHVRVERPGFDLDATLDVAPGVTVLVGPNGAGKSTLLGAIAGLPGGVPDRTTATAATVRVGDVVLDDAGTHVPMHGRRVGLMFQDPILLPRRSLLDNVAFAHARGHRVRDADRDVARLALEAVGVPAAVAASRPGEVSGGQAQRAALARTLVTDPDVLLLDEPLAAVDAAGRGDLRALLRRTLVASGRPCLVISHDLADIAALGDTVVVLEEGSVVARGTLAELAAAPPSPFVASLVGTNLHRGVARGTVTTVATATGGTLDLTTADAAEGLVHVSFSPRAVALYPRPPQGSPRNTIAGVVARVDDLGDRRHVHVEGPITVVAEVTPAAAAALDLVEGATVHAVVKATEIAVHPQPAAR